jgi:hypothetical protein
VTWITDKYGYRKTNSRLGRYSIVIIGDSNIAGSSLTQSDLLSEVLERKHGAGVYPLTPEKITDIFDPGPFNEYRPDIVIFEIIERDIPAALKPFGSKDFYEFSFWSRLIFGIRLNGAFQQTAVILDRIFKANMLNYIRARINGASPSPLQLTFPLNCPILFAQGVAANQDASIQRLERSALILKSYSDFFTRRGMRFIFFPIPNKETIHYEYLHTKRPEFLERLFRKLQELKVESVDTQKAFDDAYHQTKILLYHRDDTHWNALGVKIAADLLEKQIKIGPQRSFPRDAFLRP